MKEIIFIILIIIAVCMATMHKINTQDRYILGLETKIIMLEKTDCHQWLSERSRV